MYKQQAIQELADAIQRLASIPEDSPGNPLTLCDIIGNLREMLFRSFDARGGFHGKGS